VVELYLDRVVALEMAELLTLHNEVKSASEQE